MLFQDSNSDGSSSISTRIEYLFALQFYCSELGVENQRGDSGSIIVNFCYLVVVLWWSVDEGWLGPAESLIRIFISCIP